MQFRAGDFWLEDAPPSGRPVEVDSDQIATLIENNQCSTAREIANIFTKSIKLLVKMKNVSYFTEKKHRDFLANPIHHAQGSRYLATLQDPRALSAEMRQVSGAGKPGCSGGGGLMRALLRSRLECAKLDQEFDLAN